MKKMLFIYNPNAGTGVLKPKLSDVLDIFVKAGIIFRYQDTYISPDNIWNDIRVELKYRIL